MLQRCGGRRIQQWKVEITRRRWTFISGRWLPVSVLHAPALLAATQRLCARPLVGQARPGFHPLPGRRQRIYQF